MIAAQMMISATAPEPISVHPHLIRIESGHMPLWLSVKMNIFCADVIQTRNSLYTANGSRHGSAIEGSENLQDGTRGFSCCVGCMESRTGAVAGTEGVRGSGCRPADPGIEVAAFRSAGKSDRAVCDGNARHGGYAGSQLPHLPTRRALQDGPEIAAGGVGHCALAADRTASHISRAVIFPPLFLMILSMVLRSGHCLPASMRLSDGCETSRTSAALVSVNFLDLRHSVRFIDAIYAHDA